MTRRLSLWPVLTLSDDATLTGEFGIMSLLSVSDNHTSSGFDGPWTFSPTTLTNDFYKLLFDEKWVWKKWNGPKQYVDKGTGTLMMLP